MNWFKEWCGPEASKVHSSLRGARTEPEDTEACEHVDSGSEVTLVVSERDGFGPLSYYSMCSDCAKAHRDKERKERHICSFCTTVFEREDGRLWRPYDFYPEQGDEETPICGNCWKTSPAVKEMIREDREARDWELGGGSSD